MASADGTEPSVTSDHAGSCTLTTRRRPWLSLAWGVLSISLMALVSNEINTNVQCLWTSRTHEVSLSPRMTPAKWVCGSIQSPGHFCSTSNNMLTFVQQHWMFARRLMSLFRMYKLFEVKWDYDYLWRICKKWTRSQLYWKPWGTARELSVAMPSRSSWTQITPWRFIYLAYDLIWLFRVIIILRNLNSYMLRG
jgi:hypothetical protein